MSSPPLTPPDEPRFCPACLANVEDGERDTVGGWELVLCPSCGAWVNVEQLLDRVEARAQRREEHADAEREERWWRECGR